MATKVDVMYTKSMEKFKLGNMAAFIAAGFFVAISLAGASFAGAQSVPANATSTAPTLSIDENGNMTAQGMTVTGAASSSFNGQIWGIIYTINLPAASALASSTLSTDIIPSTGDMVNVAGTVSTSSPLTVDATQIDDLTTGMMIGATIPPNPTSTTPVMPPAPTLPVPFPAPFPVPINPIPGGMLSQLQTNLDNLISQIQDLQNNIMGQFPGANMGNSGSGQ